ncbi:hypothetical protein BJX61DRAFT_489475 [Aspergillus egyptiacus]|nr:hypothetical protein BJX61DRAFT_489475 [Aspergillus egyptiacus]
MPSLDAQKSRIEKAYSVAGCDPRDTVFAGAHSSSTAVSSGSIPCSMAFRCGT